MEFALVLIPLMIILFGLIQYGLYFWSSQAGSNTINAAARQLSVGNCADIGDLEAYVDGQLGSASTGAAGVNREYFDTDGATSLGSDASNAVIGGTVSLEVTFDTVNLNFPFVPFLDDPKVTREVVARVEDTTDQGCPA